jgi:hypothetical protein
LSLYATPWNGKFDSAGNNLEGCLADD